MRTRITETSLIAAAVAAVVVAGACSPFAAAGETAATPDAASGPSTGPPDGSDAASSQDVSVGGGQFCRSLVPAPSFCADFDDESGAVPLASALRFGPFEASVMLDGVHAVSFPRALHTISADPAGLAVTFDVQRSIEVELDARFTSLPTDTGKVSPLTLRTASGLEVYLFVDADEAYTQAGPEERLGERLAIGLEGWHHLRLRIDRDGEGGQRVSSTLDTTPIATDAPIAGARGGEVTVRVGAATIYRTEQVEAFIDNVVVRAE